MAKKLLKDFSPSSMVNSEGSVLVEVQVMVIGPPDVRLVAMEPIVKALA